MSVSLQVTDVSAIDAFRDWGIARELRGKGIEDTLMKVMRYWVEGALDNIPAGDAAKVTNYLKKQVAQYSKIGSLSAAASPTTKKGIKMAARNNEYRGTLAARIVAALNIYQARGMKFDQFYAAVQKWVNRRIFSVNLHRAGLLPARRLLRLSDRKGRMPKIKNMPGSIDVQTTDDMVGIMVENWASSHKGDGIVNLAGDAFERGLEKAVRRVEDFVTADLLTAARRTGLAASAA